jgi:hypothetical protein
MIRLSREYRQELFDRERMREDAGKSWIVEYGPAQDI